MKRGDRFKCDGEKRRYTVQAADARFAIMTKPAFGTYIYTITDLERDERGACNIILGPPTDFDTEDGAAEALKMLQDGLMAVSYRNCVPLTESERAQLQNQGRTK